MLAPGARAPLAPPCYAPFYDLHFSLYIYILYIISKYPNINITIYMQMTYYYICFFQLIHHQVSIINSPIVLMILKNILFIIIFSFNASKTTLLNLSPSPTYFPHFLNDNILISPSPTASNLEIFLIILFNSFIILPSYDITKSENYHLFRIRKIRKSITLSLTKTLVNFNVNSIILSRIYYGSSFLTNLPFSSISPLNRVIRSLIHTTYRLYI